MKFTADTADLARAVRTVRKAAPTRPAMEILGGFKVEALDGIVAITATDLSVGRRVEIEAKVTEEGSALLPPRFPSVVAAATGEVISISGDERYDVSSGRSRWQLAPLAIDHYPDEPSPEGDPVTLTDWERIKAVATAASTDNSRPLLQGVYFADGTAVATDSYRLAWTDTDTPDVPMNIPAQAIAALVGTPKSAVCDGRVLKAVTDDGAWWSQLIEGTYIKWRGLVPTAEPTVTITVRSAELVETIGRARLVAEHSPIWIEVVGGEVTIAVREGRFSEVIDAKVDGDDLSAAYNPTYLAESVAPVDEVTLGIFGGNKPMLITADWFNALIMPVRP